jgi:hypothetical protein
MSAAIRWPSLTASWIFWRACASMPFSWRSELGLERGGVLLLLLGVREVAHDLRATRLERFEHGAPRVLPDQEQKDQEADDLGCDLFEIDQAAHGAFLTRSCPRG